MLSQTPFLSDARYVPHLLLPNTLQTLSEKSAPRLGCVPCIQGLYCGLLPAYLVSV